MALKARPFSLGRRAGERQLNASGGTPGTSVTCMDARMPRAHGCAGAAQMVEDLLGHRRVFDAGNDLHPPASSSRQVSMSTRDTRFRRWAQVRAAWRSDAVLAVSPRQCRAPLPGVTRERRRLLGANTP